MVIEKARLETSQQGTPSYFSKIKVLYIDKHTCIGLMVNDGFARCWDGVIRYIFHLQFNLSIHIVIIDTNGTYCL
jgi:hypothetical protein